MEANATLKSRIVDSVIEDIIHGAYEPGAILTEKELVERYQVSKSPVRDALMDLCANQVLRSIPRYGYQVVQVDTESMYEIMEFRYYIESQSLFKAVTLVRDEDIAALRALEEQVQREMRDNPDYPVTAHWHNNTQFHLALIGIARNDYARRALARAMDIQMRGYAQYFSSHEEKGMFTVTRHTAIVDALEKRDADAAAESLRQDMEQIDLSGRQFVYQRRSSR